MNQTVLVSAICSLLLSGSAAAATFCVDTAAKLVAALDSAHANGQADEIRIVRGTYTASAVAPFLIDLAEPYGLTVRGGYSQLNGACVSAIADASRTVLDGGNTVPVLTVRAFAEHTSVPITVEGLTLRNGLHNGQGWSYASGLTILGTMNTALAINVDRIIVHSSTSTLDVVPVVSLSSDDQFVRFSNSIVRHNSTRNAPAIKIHSNDGGSALNGLSVLYNARTGLGSSIEWTGSAPGQVNASVVFGNTGGSGDLAWFGRIQYTGLRYGTIFGYPTYGSSNNFAISDPLLLSTTTARPQTASPLHDALPAGTGVGAMDVYGQARDLGGHTDVGAVEGL
jgi:hypothetical protein